MSAPRSNGNWRPYRKFDGSVYHVMAQEAGGKGKGPPGLCSLVVDAWAQHDQAHTEFLKTAFPSCDEAYFKKGDWLLIRHSSQTAWVEGFEMDINAQWKSYWTYIAAHPAHAEEARAEWMDEAYEQAVFYLKWCSFEALTSTTSKTPFPLKHSNGLATLLESLNKASAGYQPEISHETDDGRGKDQLSRGTAAQENYRLRTTLIANILMQKCSQLDARNALVETRKPANPSLGLEVLFWIVDVTSLGSFLRYLRRVDALRNPLLTDAEWRDHIWRLVKEWEEFNLISTVLLSASASILALNNIGGVPRTAILISILASFGGITTGLFCITMYQPRAPNSPKSANRSDPMDMFNYGHYILTHKSIAMVLGLPMAFLVWSLVAFMVGILSFNIVGTEISGHVSGVAYAVIGVAAAIFLLILLAIYGLVRLWGSHPGRTLLDNIQKQYRHWRRLPNDSDPEKVQTEPEALSAPPLRLAPNSSRKEGSAPFPAVVLRVPNEPLPFLYFTLAPLNGSTLVRGGTKVGGNSEQSHGGLKSHDALSIYRMSSFITAPNAGGTSFALWPAITANALGVVGEYLSMARSQTQCARGTYLDLDEGVGGK
ncbi:hypothetical protein C8R45DRAFT_1103758 [Mycena sanguinolenta]|nr:hypothetical protein C8R45DRAFT_1103758 [Mycena sanguinolenta]